jgi:hypothetical protein
MLPQCLGDARYAMLRYATVSYKEQAHSPNFTCVAESGPKICFRVIQR